VNFEKNRKSQSKIQLFDRSTNLFLNEIWIQLDGISGMITLVVDCEENWGDMVS